MVSSLLLVWDGQSPMNLSGIRSANTFPSSNSAIRTDGSAVIPQQADAFMYQGVFTGLTGTMFGTNYTSANGYGEEKYGVNVTWSKSRKQDLGIDIKFLNDNLSFVVDFFKERRDNIFLQRSTIPSYAGWIENPYANLGVVENKGIELADGLYTTAG